LDGAPEAAASDDLASISRPRGPAVEPRISLESGRGNRRDRGKRVADGVLIAKGGQAVTAGDMLARARRDAGLSIAEISIRTRIRQNVIDGIEHDDFSACGGDSGARSDIAAIALALDVDAERVVQAYDASRLQVESDWIAATKSPEPTGAEPADAEPAATEPAVAEPAVAVGTPSQEPGPVAADEDTVPIMTGPIAMGQPPRPVPMAEPLDPILPAESPSPILPGGQPRPILPGEASWPVRAALADQYPVIWIALGGALLAVAALGGILLIAGTGGQPARHAVATSRHHGGARGTGSPGRSRPGRHRPGSPGRGRSARLLAPASIAAYGPGGTGHGDSPQLARQALAGKADAPWHSAWYTTAHFGNLQPGTGLLLDMGRTVTITSARIALGNGRGADLAVRIGTAPTLASMRTVARADGVGGMVRLKTDRMRGRFVLVWFTKLPPDRAGTFQVSVYDIRLRGHP